MRISRRLLPALVLGVLGAVALPSRAADADKYLPNSTDAVLTIKVKQFLETPFAKGRIEKVKGLLKANEQLQKVLDDLGLDPLKDVYSVHYGLPAGTDIDQGLAVIEGKFDVVKAHAKGEKEAKANPDLLKVEKVGNLNLYQITDPRRGEGASYSALLDEQFLVWSRNRELAVQAINKKAGKAKPELKKELTQLLAKADAKQCITIVALEQTLANGKLGDFSGQGKTLTGGVTIGEDIKLDLAVEAKDEKTAGTVKDSIKEGLDYVKVIVGGLTFKDKKFAPLNDILATIKVDVSGATINLKGQVSKDALEKLEKLGKEDKE
jgi:hypothetical protein